MRKIQRLRTFFLVYVFLITVVDNPFTAPFNDYEALTEKLGPILFANLKAQFGIPLPFSLVEWIPAVIGYFAYRALKRERALLAIPRDLLFVSLCYFIFTATSGVVSVYLRGGDSSAVFWALKGPASVPVVFFAGFQLLRTQEHFIALGKVLIAGITLKSLQGLYYFYVVLGGDKGNYEYITTHVGSFMMSLALLVTLALQFYRPKEISPQVRRFLMLVWVVVLPAFVFNERRIEMVGLVFSLALLVFLLALFKPIKTLSWTAFSAPFIIAYIFVFRNSKGFLGAPVRMIDSLSDDENASNIYRKIENYNIIETIKDVPVLGQGMGVPMKEVIKLVDISNIYEFYLVNPHNSILWIWMSTGFVGMLLFSAWMAAFCYNGMRSYFLTSSPLKRLILFISLANIGRYLLFCYGDMMFFNSEGNVILALSMASIASLCAQENVVRNASRQPVALQLRTNQH